MNLDDIPKITRRENFINYETMGKENIQNNLKNSADKIGKLTGKSSKVQSVNESLHPVTGKVKILPKAMQKNIINEVNENKAVEKLSNFDIYDKIDAYLAKLDKRIDEIDYDGGKEKDEFENLEEKVSFLEITRRNLMEDEANLQKILKSIKQDGSKLAWGKEIQSKLNKLSSEVAKRIAKLTENEPNFYQNRNKGIN